jgi:hypothetical protein
MRCSTYNFKYFLQELIQPDCEDDISESSFRQMSENGWSDEDSEDGSIIFDRSAPATQNLCDCVVTGDIRLIQANLLANPMCLHDTDECVMLQSRVSCVSMPNQSFSLPSNFSFFSDGTTHLCIVQLPLVICKLQDCLWAQERM